MSTDVERLVSAALERRISNGWVHKHHKGCIHNLPPEEQIEIRSYRGNGKRWTREEYLASAGSMPVQITEADWEEEPLALTAKESPDVH